MKRFALLTVFLAGIATLGCAGSSNQSTTQADADSQVGAGINFEQRPILARAELTTEVDERRFRAVGPVGSDFRDNTKELFFVGQLKNIGAEAEIEVHWGRNSRNI